MRSTATHFTKLHLQNFRGFKKAEGIPLAPLTFLVGPNSAGKSSVFDALLFLAQSHSEEIGDIPIPIWTGPLVDLGAFSDVVFGHRQNLRVCVGFDIAFDTRAPWKPHKTRRIIRSRIRYEFGSSSVSKDPAGRLKYMEVEDPSSGYKISVVSRAGRRPTALANILGHKLVYPPRAKRERPSWYSLAYFLDDEVARLTRRYRATSVRPKWEALRRLSATLSSMSIRFFLEGTQRVASGRAAPKRWYPISQLLPDSARYSGIYRLYDSVDPTMIAEEKSQDHVRVPRELRKLRRQTLARVLRSLDIAKRIKTSKLSPYHFSINVRDSQLNIESKLIDVGFGASQVIPVIRACLGPSYGPLLVEQPEIHLHPKAQGIVAELLCQTSLGRQVIIETHSEHMINRARILVAQGKLDHRDIIINYVKRTKRGSQIRSIPLGPDGEFREPWPDGFFDERYQDTVKLLELTGKE